MFLIELDSFAVALVSFCVLAISLQLLRSKTARLTWLRKGISILSFEPLPTSLQESLYRWRKLIPYYAEINFLVNGPRLLKQRYFKSNEGPFTIKTPDNRLLFVSSEQHIQEVLSAPFNSLSLHAVAKELLQPKHTMYGFEWDDQRGVEGTGFVRALRSLLTAQLPRLLPTVQSIIADSFDSEMKGGRISEGTSHVKVFPMAKRVVTHANCIIFFGESLASDEAFRAAALDFPQTVIATAEILRLAPRFCQSFIARVMTRDNASIGLLRQRLIPVVQQRLQLGPLLVQCKPWLIDTSPKQRSWTPERIVGEILAIWFASVHQLAMTAAFAIEDLCTYPEWIEILRTEIQEAGPHIGTAAADPGRLPLLEQFMTESARLNTTDAGKYTVGMSTEAKLHPHVGMLATIAWVSLRRKALKPFRLSGGSLLSVGDWVCVPLQAIMGDPRHFQMPEIFDPTRFARKRSDGKLPAFTDLEPNRPIWGLGVTACPGRFYASTILKSILIHAVTKYSCNLVDPERPRSWTWRSSIIPSGQTKVEFKLVTIDSYLRPARRL